MSLFGVTNERLRQSYNMIREAIDDHDLTTMKFMIYLFTTIYIVLGGGYYINLITTALPPSLKCMVWKIILFSIGAEYSFFINKNVSRLLYPNVYFLNDVNSVMVMTIKGLSEVVCDTCYAIQFNYYKRNDDLYKQMKQYTKNKELSTRNHHGFDGIMDVDD